MTGEVGIEIAPAVAVGANPEAVAVAERVDQLLRRTCDLARALTHAEQAALKLTVDDDPTLTRKYFSLSAKYADWHDYRAEARGVGLHTIDIPRGEAVRLTQAEVERHPLWEAFGAEAPHHPPFRGWLAAPVDGDSGRRYGLLQLSDKAGGADFDARDEELILELVALVGAALDALRAAHESPAAPAH